MRAYSLVPLALAATAFVIPDAETAQSLQLQAEEGHSFWDNIKQPANIWEELEERFMQASRAAQNGLDDAAEWLEESVDTVNENLAIYGRVLKEDFAGEAWVDSVQEDVDLFEGHPPPPPPHHGPPPHGPPHHGPPHRGPPHHGPPHHGPHHPHKSNLTVYQLIAESKYTTKLAKALSEFPDLVKLLNSTEANYTVFAPTDRAFEKIPKHAPKPPKEFLEKLLTYHVSPRFYPAGRILVTRTIPTALEAKYIGKVPQRLATQIGVRGLTINFYSRVVAPNIFGSNGVIHGIDSILVPPPKAIDIISALPGEFSTLELALFKTGLYEKFNDTNLHNGGTLFAPSNFGFKLLGPRINAFLFSKYGEKYLKALILYHVSKEATLYSDAIYKVNETDSQDGHCRHRIPRGLYHIDLQTGLRGKSLGVDIARFGRLITIKINAFTRVTVSDGIAADGVIHLISNVLIPPKSPGEDGILTEAMSVEELKERLEPFVDETDVGYDL